MRSIIKIILQALGTALLNDVVDYVKGDAIKDAKGFAVWAWAFMHKDAHTRSYQWNVYPRTMDYHIEGANYVR